jgi:hypothetical protein
MPELAFATKIYPTPASRGKPAKMKLLAFVFFDFLESRLSKGLLPIQIIKKVRGPPRRRAVPQDAVSLRSMGISVTSISDFCKKKAWLSAASPNINQAAPPGRRPGADNESNQLPADNGTLSLDFSVATGPAKPSSPAPGCRRRSRIRSEKATAGLAASMLLASTPHKLTSWRRGRIGCLESH